MRLFVLACRRICGLLGIENGGMEAAIVENQACMLIRKGVSHFDSSTIMDPERSQTSSFMRFVMAIGTADKQQPHIFLILARTRAHQ